MRRAANGTRDVNPEAEVRALRDSISMTPAEGSGKQK
jgi:hypothetical protein